MATTQIAPSSTVERVPLAPDLTFSRLVQGFWRLPKWGWSTGELVRFLHECIQRGVTTIDTAEVYGDGECERQLGLAFNQDPSLRRQLQLVTKGGIYKQPMGDRIFGYYNTTGNRLIQSCKASLERLQVDAVDVYLIHREDPCFYPWDAAEGLQTLQKEGLIRYAGASNFDPFKFDALNTAMGGTLVTDQIECSPVCFEHFNSGMMDTLAKLRVHPMIWSPLAGGRLFTGEEEIYQKVRAVLGPIAQRHGVSETSIVYAWLMYHPVAPMPISGSSKPGRLDEAIAALGVRLERWEWYQIYAASGQQIIR